MRAEREKDGMAEDTQSAPQGKKRKREDGEEEGGEGADASESAKKRAKTEEGASTQPTEEQAPPELTPEQKDRLVLLRSKFQKSSFSVRSAFPLQES